MTMLRLWSSWLEAVWGAWPRLRRECRVATGIVGLYLMSPEQRGEAVS